MTYLFLALGWLLIGASGGTLLWFLAEREYYPSSGTYHVRVGDLWLYGFLSLFGPVTLLLSCIYALVSLLGKTTDKFSSDRVVMTIKKRAK